MSQALGLIAGTVIRQLNFLHSREFLLLKPA
jgi:hypothetical protein